MGTEDAGDRDRRGPVDGAEAVTSPPAHVDVDAVAASIRGLPVPATNESVCCLGCDTTVTAGDPIAVYVAASVTTGAWQVQRLSCQDCGPDPPVATRGVIEALGEGHLAGGGDGLRLGAVSPTAISPPTHGSDRHPTAAWLDLTTRS